MKTSINEPQPQFSPPLVALDDFIQHHHPPINLRWAIQCHVKEMTRLGVITRFGRKILIDPKRFWDWLRATPEENHG